MPYIWTQSDPNTDYPPARLRLWPNQSLGAGGFVAFFGITAVMIGIPLLAVLGSPVVWAVLPFAGITFWGMWAAIGRNRRDAQRLSEELVLAPGLIAITRHSPRGEQSWQANPQWVRLSLHADGGPVPDYLTLRGNGREVELGAFLSDGERRALYADLTERLARLR